MNGPTIRWRAGGHQLHGDADLLRFEVTDINHVIRNATGHAHLYRGLQDDRHHPAEWQVLVLSCFAITPKWDPRALAKGTGFRQYRVAAAGVVLAAGYELWPTEVILDGVPDPRNEVHYDLIVAAGPDLVPAALTTGSPSERRTARAALLPLFDRVLALFGKPVDLTAEPGSPGPVH